MTLISEELRCAVSRRAGHRCEYCLLPQSSQVATFPVDHVIPLDLNGLTRVENLCLACPRCNALKWTFISARDPLSGEVVTIFSPRKDRWEAHFRWSPADPCVLEGLTTTGRATIALLDLNSPARVVIRRWLSRVGLHPSE